MGNSLNNCVLCEDNLRQKEKDNSSTLSYSDLPAVVKYNDQKRHKKFKHGFISRNAKASINDQLNLTYKAQEQNMKSSNTYNHSSDVPLIDDTVSEQSCRCKQDEYHRIVSP